jgi:hypothetical protein
VDGILDGETTKNNRQTDVKIDRWEDEWTDRRTSGQVDKLHGGNT